MRSKKDKTPSSEFQSPKIRLGDLMESIFAGMVLSRQPKEGLFEAPTRIINTRDIEEGILISPGRLEEVQLPATSQTDRYRVQDGDVLVSARGAFKVARVQTGHAGAVAGPNLIVVRPGRSLKPELLYAFLRHPDIQSEIHRQSVKTTVASIGIETIANLRIKVPEASKQSNLAQLVDLAERQYELSRRIAEIRRVLGHELVGRKLIV